MPTTSVYRWRPSAWMVLGAPIFAFALWQIFVPAETASVGSLLGWSALLYLRFTMVDWPPKAWDAELSSDYDERSRITSWREGLSTAGQVALLAALVLWAAGGVRNAAAQLRGSWRPRRGWRSLACRWSSWARRPLPSPPLHESGETTARNRAVPNPAMGARSGAALAPPLTVG